MGEKKYQITYETLRMEILSGKYSRRNTFPSVMAIVRRFGISRLTAVKVLDLLKGDGLVYARSGAGTFVSRQGVCRRIGLILPGIVPCSEYFHPIVSEMTRLAQTEAFELRLGNIYSQDVKARTHEVRELAATFIREKVAGVIYQPIEYVDDAEDVNVRILSALTKAKIPVVLLDSDILPPPGRSQYDLVTIDNADAGERIADHLFERGAVNVHFFRYPETLSTVAKRLRGVIASSVRHGHTWTDGHVLVAQPEDKIRIRSHLRKKPRPDAFVCANDTMAAILLRTLSELRVSVPNDVMLAGFDDIQLARLTTPPLTTIRQPCAQIAETAFRRLVDRVAHPGLPPICISLPAPLVVRGSTGRPHTRAAAGSGKRHPNKAARPKHPRGICT